MLFSFLLLLLPFPTIQKHIRANRRAAEKRKYWDLQFAFELAWLHPFRGWWWWWGLFEAKWKTSERSSGVFVTRRLQYLRSEISETYKGDHLGAVFFLLLLHPDESIIIFTSVYVHIREISDQIRCRVGWWEGKNNTQQKWNFPRKI